MQQRVKVREKLIVYIMDNKGNVIRTEEYNPPRNILEKIASDLGILKRANSVNSMGWQIAAKRFVGVSVNPVRWIAAKDSAGSWQFRSAQGTVFSNNAVLKNPVATFSWKGAPTGYYTDIGAATSNHASQIVSIIPDLGVTVHDGEFWVEIEYDFS